MRTVLFVRANNEEGVNKQIENLNKYCAAHKHDVITSPFVVIDKKDRLAVIEKMMKFCKDNKDSVDLVLFTDFSRLTRKAEEGLLLLSCLYNWGITPWAIYEPPLFKGLQKVG